MRASLSIALILVVSPCVASLCAACDSAPEFRNVQPRVTWVAVGPPEQGVARITVWISDRDGDPVDLEVSWEAPGGSAQPITLGPGGHGVVGLTTDLAVFDPAGQPHEIMWDVTGVPEGAAQLRFVAEDGQTGRTAPVVSPVFLLPEGLSEAAALTPADE